MAVVNAHGRPAQHQREFTPWSIWFFGRSDPASPKSWLTGIAFLALYLAFNKLTVWNEFDGLGITLWSPDNGLSLALLTEGAMFAPFVFLGAVLTDAFIAGIHHSLYVTVAAELVLTIGYVGLAAVLRHKLKFNSRQVRLADVVVLLIFVPAGATLTSLSYCGVLYLGDSLPAEQFSAATRHFWIGDTVGMITIIPAVTSVFGFLSKPRWRWSGYALFSFSVFILGTCLGFVVLFGVGEAKEYHMFYLLFLPIILVAGRLRRRRGCAANHPTDACRNTAYVGWDAKDFGIFQTLMLVLSITGLLLGAVTTERRNAALLLREQQTELARVSAYATAGAMGTILAHEISQPFSSVATYLHAAKRMLRSGVAGEPVMDVLNKAEAEAQRTREVLERVRDFVSNGKMDLKALDISALAGKIAALCREDAATRGIQVEIESARPVPLVTSDNNPDRASFEQSRRQRDRRGLGAGGRTRACDHTPRHARRQSRHAG